MTAPTTLAQRYELTSPIGRGGMGEVWSGYDKRLDRRVAVKLLRAETLPAGTDQRALARRFVRESRLTARVEHPGVPAVFDAGDERGWLYLVMQLVPGIDLVDFLTERAPLAATEAAAVCGQITSILAAAHDVSLIHRDLKPSNVMIRPDGTVVVLDFGVAALLDPDITRLTVTGEMLGSPAYMAPEQVLGGRASTRSDLYSLGCILHQMLAGARPFDAEGSFAAMRQHVDDPPPPLRSIRPDVPEGLERLVLDMLAKEPANRPSDAAAVFARLREHLPQPGHAVDEHRYDTARPYRLPFGVPQRTDARRDSVTVEPRQPRQVSDVDGARNEAAELAEAGRFTQAAALLTTLLQPGMAAESQARGVRLQLANTLLLGGDFREALPHYEQLIADVTAERGADDDDVLAWHVQAATCLDALGQPDQALDMLQPVIHQRCDHLGVDDPEVVELRKHAALLRASAGQHDQAQAEVHALLREVGPDHVDVPTLTELARRLGG